MVSMLTSSGVDRGIEPRSDQAKDHKIDICYFSATLTPERRKGNTGWLRNRILRTSGAACLPANYYFSELAL
jgi:hypothetical protein